MATITRVQTRYYEEKIPVKLMDFCNWKFTSGGSTGKDFKTFARKFKNYLKKEIPDNWEIVNYSTGHYYMYGFITDGSRYVYFSISDVRFFPGQWFNAILIRTAEHDKDYTGGSNMYTNLVGFVSNVKKLM